MRSSRDPTPARGLAAVLGLLLVTGWAANHFAALIPVLAEVERLDQAVLDGVFGVYALGLVPGLVGGGAASDRLGRVAVVLPGALLAAGGTLLLLLDHDATGLLAGRFVVGLGAGLTFGAGTAWAADLGGRAGTVLAGVFLTSGFAVGPLVSGALATLAPAPLAVPFVVSAALSVLAVAAARAYAVPVTPRRRPTSDGRAPSPTGGSARAALAWALPVGVLVFASVTVPLLTLPPRLPGGLDGPLLVGVAAVLALGSGVVVQAVARRRSFGPRAGIAGALCAAAAFGGSAAAGPSLPLVAFLPLCVLFGSAYGLCLREGLLDIESLAPVARRGVLTGVYYVVTYLGFGLPLLLTSLEPAAGVRAPAAVLAAVALAIAALRTRQVAAGHPAR